MSILDRQSGRRAVGNRKLSPRRQEERRRRRSSQGREPFVANASGTYPVARPPSRPSATQEITLSDRRRPGRGFADPDPSPQSASSRGRLPTMRTEMGQAVGEALFDLGRKLLVLVVLPAQLLLLLLRPRELARRVLEAPALFRSTARRLRLQTRDPESAAGRMWETMRLSAHFVREELADMQDGFPSFDAVARSSVEALSSSGRHVSGRISSRISAQREEVYARLQHSAALGLVAGVVVVGLFVAGYQALESLKQSDRLSIQDIQVQGLDRVERSQLLEALVVGEGDNLLELEPAVLSARAAGLPWVAGISLRRDLRGQRLELAVVEHEAVMVLGDEPLMLMNESGEVFKQVQPGDPIDLPFLTLEDRGLAERPAELRQIGQGAVQILRALDSGTALREVDVSEIRFEGEAGFVVLSRTGLPVRLGREDFAVRLGRLERAVRGGALPLHALASVDLGLRDRLVAVPRDARSARKAFSKGLSKQPMGPAARARVLELEGSPRTRISGWDSAGQ